jgi:hypothetical protein
MSLDELDAQGGVAGVGEASGDGGNADIPEQAAEFQAAANTASNAPVSNEVKADTQARLEPLPNEAQSVVALLQRIPEAMGEFRVGMREGGRKWVQDTTDLVETANGTPANMIPVQKPYEMADSNAAKLGHALTAVVTAPLSFLMSPAADSIRAEANALKKGASADEATGIANQTYVNKTIALVSTAFNPAVAAGVGGLSEATQGTIDGEIKSPMEYAQRAATSAVMAFGLDKFGGFVMNKIMKGMKGADSTPPNSPPNQPPTGLAPAYVTAGSGAPSASIPHSSFDFNPRVMYSKAEDAGAGASGTGKNIASGKGHTGEASAGQPSAAAPSLTPEAQKAQDRATLFKPDRSEGFKGLFSKAESVEGLPHLSEIKLPNGAHVVVDNEFRDTILANNPNFFNDVRGGLKHLHQVIDVTNPNIRRSEPVSFRTHNGEDGTIQLFGKGNESYAYRLDLPHQRPLVVKVNNPYGELESHSAEKMLLAEQLQINNSSDRMLQGVPKEKLITPMMDAQLSDAFGFNYLEEIDDIGLEFSFEYGKTLVAISHPNTKRLSSELTISEFYPHIDSVNVRKTPFASQITFDALRVPRLTGLGTFQVDYMGSNIARQLDLNADPPRISYTFFDPILRSGGAGYANFGQGDVLKDTVKVQTDSAWYYSR